MKIYENIAELVGSTPLLKISDNLFAKLEYLNPAGSIKDRAALYILKDAEERGILKSGDTVIEPTSGNTGIGLAAIGVSRGYRVIITMPDSMSAERIKTMEALGAEVVLTDGALGMDGAIKKAEELQSSLGGIIAGQFINPANPNAHYNTTGPEIYRDTDQKVDCVVCSVGTGGTVSGIGKYLKEQNPNIKIIAVEPASSPVLSGGKKGAHKIQGIGAGFVPEILDLSVIDEIMTVTDEEAYAEGRRLAGEKGILVGISSGAALAAAKKLSKANPELCTVVIFPDSGLRYLSTENYY